MIQLILTYISSYENIDLVSKVYLNNINMCNKLIVDKKYIYMHKIGDCDYLSTVQRINLSDLIFEKNINDSILRYNSQLVSKWDSMTILDKNMYCVFNFYMHVYDFLNFRNIGIIENKYPFIDVTSNNYNVFYWIRVVIYISCMKIIIISKKLLGFSIIN